MSNWDKWERWSSSLFPMDFGCRIVANPKDQASKWLCRSDQMGNEGRRAALGCTGGIGKGPGGCLEGI